MDFTLLNLLFLMCYFRFGVAPNTIALTATVLIVEGGTVLFVASMQGNELAMDFLLERMAGVQAIARPYFDALKETISNGRNRTLVKLLDWSASVGAHSGGFENILETGARFGNQGVAKAIMETEDHRGGSDGSGGELEWE